MRKGLSRVYVAGFFDGEGCVRIERVRNFFFISVQVTGTHKQTIYELRDQYGGCVVAMKVRSVHHNQAYKWRITNRGAAAFLEDVLPFLRQKRIQAIMALTLQEQISLNAKKGGIPLSKDTIRARAELKKLIEAAKH